MGGWVLNLSAWLLLGIDAMCRAWRLVENRHLLLLLDHAAGSNCCCLGCRCLYFLFLRSQLSLLLLLVFFCLHSTTTQAPPSLPTPPLTQPERCCVVGSVDEDGQGLVAISRRGDEGAVLQSQVGTSQLGGR